MTLDFMTLRLNKIASSFLLAMTCLEYFAKIPSREGLGVCIISCKLTVDSLQRLLAYKSKIKLQKSKIKNRYPRALLELAKQSTPCIRG